MPGTNRLTNLLDLTAMFFGFERRTEFFNLVVEQGNLRFQLCRPLLAMLAVRDFLTNGDKHRKENKSGRFDQPEDPTGRYSAEELPYTNCTDMDDPHHIANGPAKNTSPSIAMKYANHDAYSPTQPTNSDSEFAILRVRILPSSSPLRTTNPQAAPAIKIPTQVM
jgi:hypothetical protein